MEGVSSLFFLLCEKMGLIQTLLKCKMAWDPLEGSLGLRPVSGVYGLGAQL